MEKLKIAVVGYGNVGKAAVDAVLASPDMKLSAIILRPSSKRKVDANLKASVAYDIKDVSENIDVALLAVGSRQVAKLAPFYLEQGINTVDAYDIHGDAIIKLRKDLNVIAKKHNCVAVISAGWDPGTDSITRAIFETISPKGITNVNFGPGMSMGHTVAVKAIEGVKDALSVTVPLGMGIHRRMVYVEIDSNFSFEKVKKAIKNDPYFIKDETHVIEVDNVKDYIDMGHGVYMERKGVAGKTHNQKLAFSMSIDNPAVTGQVMVSAARASMRQEPGCYSLLEIPPVDFLYGNKEEILKRLI